MLVPNLHSYFFLNTIFFFDIVQHDERKKIVEKSRSHISSRTYVRMKSFLYFSYTEESKKEYSLLELKGYAEFQTAMKKLNTLLF